MSTPGGPAAQTTTATAPPSVVRNFVTLGIGELLSRVIGFLGTIYIARQLGSEAYGVVGFAFAVLLYFGAVGDLGMEQLGPREISRAGGQLALLAASMSLSRLAASGLIALAMTAVGLGLMTRPEGPVLALYGLTLLATGASTRWVHIGLEQARSVAVSRFLIEGVRVSLLLLYVHGPADLYRVPLAQFAGESAAALQLYISLRVRGVRLRPRIDTALVRTVLHHAAPLLVTNLLALVIYNADVLILRAFRGRAEVGLYLAAYTLINFLGVLGNTATLSILPAFSRLRATHGGGGDLFRAAMGQVAAVGLPMAVGGAMLAPALVALIFGPDYAASSPILRVLLLSIPVLLLRSVLQAALIAAGRQDRVLHTTAWSAAITLTLDFSLIPLLGMMGAAITTVLAEVARMLIAQHYGGAVGYGRPPLLHYWRPVLAVLVMAGALLLLGQRPVWLAVPVGAITYGVVLLAVGGLRRGSALRASI